MSREVLIVRHGEAERPTEKDGPFGPRLTPAAIEETSKLRGIAPLAGIDNGEVASSAKERATETGLLLGAAAIHIYRSLNEIEPATPYDELKAMLAEGDAPDEFMAAGEFTLACAPAEQYWIMHGWRGASVIAAAAYHQRQDIAGTNLLLPNLGAMTITVP